MKVTHYICPRVCGKTTFAENLQKEDPENILLFQYANGQGWVWGQSMRRERWDKIIFDEYILRYNSLLTQYEKDKLVNWIKCVVINTLNKGGELILISTPDKLYSQELVLLAKLNLKYYITQEDYKGLDSKHIQEKIKEFNCKCLNTAEDIDIIKTNFDHPIDERLEREAKKLFSNEKFLTEVKGEYLI